MIINIDQRDLENVLRHCYLLASGNDPKIAFATKEGEEEWISFREEVIAELISDYLQNGYECYNNICGSQEHPELR